jgi:hypothetical protein
MNNKTRLGSTDTTWINATAAERRKVIDHIQQHARDDKEAAEFFTMITGHQPGSEKQR